MERDEDFYDWNEEENIYQEILGLQKSYADSSGESYEDLRAKKEKDKWRGELRKGLKKICLNSMIPFVGFGMIEGANFLHDKEEEKVRMVCDSLEAKIKEGIVSEKISKDYFRELSERISGIRNVGLSNKDANYLNEIEQYLYKVQRSSDFKEQRTILTDTFPNIYEIKEVEESILFSTTVLLGFGLIWYGFYRLGKQIKHLYKARNKMNQRLKDLKDELGD